MFFWHVPLAGGIPLAHKHVIDLGRKLSGQLMSGILVCEVLNCRFNLIGSVQALELRMGPQASLALGGSETHTCKT